jgi:hypothetical protein
MWVPQRDFAVFVYIVSMATISQITSVSKIHGAARVISLATTTITTKAITKTITIR